MFSPSGAIKMDKVTRSFIEHLAVADTLITILFYLPMFTSLVAGHWIFGPRLCWFMGFFGSHVPFMAEILIIATISCYRLWVMRKPPGVRSRMHLTHVKVIVAAIWVISSVPVFYWMSVKASAFYLSRGMICWTSNHLPHSPSYMSTKIFTVIFIAAPMITVFLANIKLVHSLVLHTLRARQPIFPHLKPVVTVSLICWALLVSYIPIFILIILKTTSTPIPSWFNLFQVYAKGFHVVLNPFIYVATNARFRNFVTRRLGYQNGYGRASGESPTETPLHHNRS